MKRLLAITLVLALGLWGCSSGGGGGGNQADVTEFKEAVPNSLQLAKIQIPDTTGRAVAAESAKAYFPSIAVPVAVVINGVVESIVTSLEKVVDYPYSHYDAEKGEVFWGPFDNEGGAGKLVLLVKKLPKELPDDPVSYSWVIFRVPDGFDLAAAIASGQKPDDAYPVIAGYSVPNGPDGYFGFAMLDLGADAAAGQALGDSGPFGQGVFLAAYGSYTNLETPDTRLEYVMSVFRDFRSKDSLETPIDVDYLYGNLVGPQANLTFFNFVTSGNIIATTSAEETMKVRLAFLNKADGRAEVEVTGGDVTGSGYADECWNASIDSTYLAVSDGVNSQTLIGSPEACTDPFKNTLDELNIPTTENPEDMAALFTQLGAMADAGIAGLTGL